MKNKFYYDNNYVLRTCWYHIKCEETIKSSADTFYLIIV